MEFGKKQSARDEPAFNTAGNRSFKWYSNWQQEPLCCSACGWVGLARIDSLQDANAAGAIVECQQCQKAIGEVLFPSLQDTRVAAAQGNEQAIGALPNLIERFNRSIARADKFEQEKITTIQNLPELEGDSLEFAWDFTQADDEFYQVIRLGNAELWRELAFFENIERFNQVKKLLRQKYGKHFKSLTPTRESLEWLCGDNAGKLSLFSFS